MRIRYRRSGGIAGVDLTTDTTSDQLSPEFARVADELLSGAPAGSGSTSTAMPDRFSYTLELDDGSRRHTVQWAESDVPDEARPLLAELNRQARPTPA